MYPNYTRYVTLSAFDVGGNLIATNRQLDVGGETLAVSAAGIHSVRFSEVDLIPLDDGTYGGGVAIDDLTFDTVTPVPEPPSWVLSVVGIGACLVFRSLVQRTVVRP